jgi:hypothetical protein
MHRVALATLALAGCGSQGGGGPPDGQAGLDSAALDLASLEGDLAAPDLAMAAPIDLAPSGDIAGQCNGLTGTAPFITRQQVASSPPPMTGGMLVDGTYFLTAYAVYTGTGGATGPTGAPFSELVVHAGGFAEAVVQTQGSPILTRQNNTITTSGNNYVTTVVCPAGAPSQTLSYTATANVLTIVDAMLTPPVMATLTRQ